MKFTGPGWFFLRWFAQFAGTLALWTLWLVLSVALALQIYIAASPEFTVPQALIRPWEDRLAFAGLRATFDRVRFDPRSGVTIDKLQIYSLTFSEPIATFDSLYFDCDLWMLSVGHFDPRHVRAHGVDFYVPAMFSATGAREAFGHDFSFAANIGPGRAEFSSLNGRVGRLAVSARGGVTLPTSSTGVKHNVRDLVADALRSYFQTARQISSHVVDLDDFEDPRLELQFTPDPFRVATVQAQFLATGARIDARRFKANASWKEPVELTGIRARGALPLAGNIPSATQVELAVNRLACPPWGTAEQVRAVVNAAVNPTSVWFDPNECSLYCARITAGEYEVESVIAALKARLPHSLSGDISLLAASGRWSIDADTNLTQRGGTAHIEGRVTPQLLDLVGKKIGRDLGKVLAPETPPDLSVDLTFDDGWKLGGIAGAFRTGPTVARGVAIDRASGRFHFSGHEFAANDISLYQGPSKAFGSYEMDTATQQYRFLLTGQLAPEGIAGWFSSWWPRFWRSFDFSAGGPVADVDVQGQWGAPHLSTVFVAADCARPVIRGVDFDEIHTVLFIRPDFYDGLETAARRNDGHAHGTFRRRVDLQKDAFRDMDFDVVSDLELAGSGKLFGEPGIEIVSPFTFERPPLLKIKGHLDGPAAPDGEHDSADVVVTSTGALTFYDFPLNDLSVHARLDGDKLTLSDLTVGVAGGNAAGTAERTGKSGSRNLTFDCTFTDLNLGEAIRTGENFAAKRKGLPPPPQSKFQQRVAPGKLSLKLKATGAYSNPFGYDGEGTAEIAGAELADVHLLGTLSEVLRGISALNFTSVRLDTARCHFLVQHDRLVFDDVRLHGPTAAVDAKGFYRLDAKTMDFYATVRPFEEGKTLLANAIDLVLTPISAVLQLRLTGALDNPNWRFAYGPTSFFRKIAGADDVETSPSPVSPAAPQNDDSVPKPPRYLRR